MIPPSARCQDPLPRNQDIEVALRRTIGDCGRLHHRSSRNSCHGYLDTGRASQGVRHSVVGRAVELGIMGIITPFADAASPIYANSGYSLSGDYWRLGTDLSSDLPRSASPARNSVGRNTLGAVAVQKSVRKF
jgi:hypothetical protein